MTTPPGLPLYQRAELERFRLGLTKGEFAAKVGIGRVTYDRLRTQPERPIARTVKKICDAIGFPIDKGLRLVGHVVVASGEAAHEWRRTVDDLAAFLWVRLDEDLADLENMTGGALVQGYLRVNGHKLKADIHAKRLLLSWLERTGEGAAEDNLWTYDELEPLKILALPYAEHSDYREEWKP